MDFQMMVLAGSVRAVGAGVRPFPRVRSHVSFEILLSDGAEITERTSEGFFSSMFEQMSLHMTRVGGNVGAEVTPLHSTCAVIGVGW